MVKRGKRDRSRSKTPEVPWELLLSDDAPPPPVYTNSAKISRTSASGENGSSRPGDPAPAVRSVSASANSAAPVPVPGNASVASAGSDPDEKAEQAKKLESESWPLLVGMLCALRGDPKTETLLRERHPELRQVPELVGAGTKRSQLSLDKAREVAREWFARGLRGSNRHGPAERTKLCTELIKVLKAHESALLSPPGAIDERRLQELLRDGPPDEEGPLICCLLRGDVVGSRFENLWVSRLTSGLYILGDEHEGSKLPPLDQDGARIHPRVRVVVKVRERKLVIEGFYHEGEDDFLNPARVPIGPFLTVYFEGIPLKEALARWKDGPPPPPSAVPKPTVVSAWPELKPVSAWPEMKAAAQPSPPVVSAWPEIKEPPLPPGWEMRESRSKKGVYYYANPSKGLSQMERPRA